MKIKKIQGLIDENNEFKQINNSILNENENIKKKNNILSNENLNLNNNNNEILNETNAIREKNQILSNENEKLKQATIELSNENKDLKNKNNLIENENKIFKNNNNKISNEIKNIKEENQDLSYENNKLKENNKLISNENQNIKQKYNVLLTENNDLKLNNNKNLNDYNIVKKKNQELLNENQFLKQKKNEAENENKELKQTNNQIINEIKNLKGNNKKLSNENNYLQQKNQELSNENKNLTENNNLTLNKIKGLTENNQQISNEKKLIQQKYQELSNENKKLTENNKVLLIENEKMKTNREKMEKISNENKTLNQNINIKDNLIQRLLKEKEIKDEDINKLNENLNEKDQIIKNKSTEIQIKKKEIINQKQMNQNLNGIINQNQIQIKNLQNENMKLNQVINQMKQFNPNQNQINNNFQFNQFPIFMPNIQNQLPVYNHKKRGKIIPSMKVNPQKGLVNIGSTCYMNATLQCFSQTEPLSEYFLDKSHKEIILKGRFNENNSGLRLAKEYYNVITNLWTINGIKFYEPKQFKYVLGKMNPLFEKMEASDAKDMIIYFLEQIHNEINLVKVPEIPSPNLNLNQYNRDQMLQHFCDEFKKTFRSVVSDNFFIIVETTQKCQNCKSKKIPNYICYNYNIQNCFIFPLEEVRKFREKKLMFQMNQMMMGMIPMDVNQMMNGNMGMNMMQSFNEVTLDDCFDFNQKEDLMTGQNQIYCNLCHQNSDSLYGNKIFSLPNILIMILNRGKDNIYKVALKPPIEINLTRFVMNATEQYIYSIYGVITHIGESGQSGHFVASCKSPIDNQWYNFNDSIVRKINDFNKEVVNFQTPYILFYERK